MKWPVEMEQHEIAAIDVVEGAYVISCACRWRSPLMISYEELIDRWQEHRQVTFGEVETIPETERRQQTRRPAEYSATLQHRGGRHQASAALTIDLSEGGARVLGPAAFKVGDVVLLRIVATGISIENQGLVVGRQPHSNDTATLNVAFKTLDEDSADTYDASCNTQQSIVLRDTSSIVSDAASGA